MEGGAELLEDAEGRRRGGGDGGSGEGGGSRLFEYGGDVDRDYRIRG